MASVPAGKHGRAAGGRPGPTASVPLTALPCLSRRGRDPPEAAAYCEEGGRRGHPRVTGPPRAPGWRWLCMVNQGGGRGNARKRVFQCVRPSGCRNGRCLGGTLPWGWGRFSVLGYGRVMRGSSLRMRNVPGQIRFREGRGAILEHEAVPLTHPRWSVLGATSRRQGLCPGEPVTWARVTGQVPSSDARDETEVAACLPQEEAAGSPALPWSSVSDLPGPWEWGEFRRLRWHLDVCGPVV